MDSNIKKPKRINKFAGKKDVSRETTDQIITVQIDRLSEISRTNNETAAKFRESVEVLYKKQIPVNTERFEQISENFIDQMNIKLKKVKHPSKGLIWYIVMWGITLISAFIAGYYIQEYRSWKEKAIYWHQQYKEASTQKLPTPAKKK